MTSRSASTIEPSATQAHVAALRELAPRDELAAQDAAWAWFGRLGKLAADDRAAGAGQLAELFACGDPPRGLSGPTEGILVAPLLHPVPDTVLRQIASSAMPWLGKRFDADEGRGD